MSRRLLPVLCTAALATAALAVTSTPADAHRPYRPCVIAKYDARFYPLSHRCHGHHHHDCWRDVGRRAFRIMREAGRYLVVWNHVDRQGLMEHGDLRIVREKYCRAAGI